MIVKSESGARTVGNIVVGCSEYSNTNAIARLSDRHLTTPTANEAPLLCGLSLWFNCLNLIIKYVPEKPLKNAFYNYRKADYTIESEMP